MLCCSWGPGLSPGPRSYTPDAARPGSRAPGRAGEMNHDRTAARNPGNAIGTVSFTMTEASHVYLCSEGSKGQAVTIRGIPYHVAYHCHLVDGKWTAKDYHDPYLSRKDCYKEASQAGPQHGPRSVGKGLDRIPCRAPGPKPASRASQGRP